MTEGSGVPWCGARRWRAGAGIGVCEARRDPCSRRTPKVGIDGGGCDTLRDMTSLRLLDPSSPALVRTSPTVDSLSLLMDPSVDRETVLERVDRETLLTAPFTLLLSTALALAPPDAVELTEDAVIRQTLALTHEQDSLAAHARLLAETFVLTNVEYQSAILACTEADRAVPSMSDFKNPQHYLEALKIHERRMDRLQRARNEVFGRLTRASELYREALLTRDGLEVLREISLQGSEGHTVPGTIPSHKTQDGTVHIEVTVR